MATPQSTASDEPLAPKKLEQITFRFCSECSNMLYPKEDEEAHKLQFTCRTCQYTEDAHSTCVFRNVLNNSSGETAGVTQDVGSDPTVSEVPPVLCLGCSAIIFCATCGQAASEVYLAPGGDARMDSMGLCQFVMPWNSLDLFAEFHEEMEVEDNIDTSDVELQNISDASDSASEEFCHDGAVIVDL